jgi:Xaa-Pro aminopeptidase
MAHATGASKLSAVSENTEQVSEPDVSAERPISDRWVWVGAHRPAVPRALIEHMSANWESAEPSVEVHPAATFSAARRTRLAERFADKTLVIASGNPKVRANDTHYRFRPGTDFFYLTGCVEPDTVLVIAPGASGPRSTLYVAERRDHQTHEFFTDAHYGELWVGPRRGVTEAAAYYQIDTAPLEHLAKDLASLKTGDVLTLRGFDAKVDHLVVASEGDDTLASALGEQRLVKDNFEIAQLQLAVDYTVKGFEDVVRALPAAEGRGERVIEGIFNLRARVEGNDVGYDAIAASGANATILHWTRNDGSVRRGDLLLLDAGVECHNLYTADVTRTMPVSGTFSDAQRRIYDLVLAAHEAGIAAVKPGVAFMAPNDAAMKVLAEGLFALGILKEAPEVALRKDRQLQRRYTLHGVSHMLGLDVHDCANARNEQYHGDLQEGYVLTIEPGLYFQANDLTVPAEYRGIGVRIEDDVLVTADGARNLSAALPRAADEVEAWMSRLWAEGSANLNL